MELPGSDLAHWYGDSDAFADEIEEFISGTRTAPDNSRVLATLLFTDIVDSTKKAADLGDRGWGELLAAHHEVVRGELDRFRGREINTAGDGFLASFDGPARASRCAQAIASGLNSLGIEIRAGCWTCGSFSPLQGEGRGFETLSAHGAWNPDLANRNRTVSSSRWDGSGHRGRVAEELPRSPPTRSGGSCRRSPMHWGRWQQLWKWIRSLGKGKTGLSGQSGSRGSRTMGQVEALAKRGGSCQWR